MSLSIFGLVFANGPLSHVEYSTFIGWTWNDHNGGMYKWWMAKDSDGNVYIIGMTTSDDYPTTSWALQTTYSGSWDCVVSKFDPTLTNVLASTYIWWVGDDRCSDIEIDVKDNVYITMNTTSTWLPTQWGSYDTLRNGRDTYIARLDSNLTSIQASTYFGGTSNELYGTDMEFAADGSIYFTAATASTNLPIVGTPFQATRAWSYDIFVAHMDANLSTLLASTYLWGTQVELYNNSLEIDNNGDIVVRWHTRSDDFPTTIWAYDTTFNALWTIFNSTNNTYSNWTNITLSKFDPTLTKLLHSTYIWGNKHDYYSYYNWDFDFDDNNDVYLIWSTQSTDFPVTAGAYDTVFQSTREAFILKISEDFSTLQASTFLWWNSSEMWSSIELMDNGNIMFLWASPVNIDGWPTSDAFDPIRSGWDNMLWIMSPDLRSMEQMTYMWWTSWSDYNYETDESLILDGECVYFTSSSNSSNSSFPVHTWSGEIPYQWNAITDLVLNASWVLVEVNTRDYTITKMCPASCGDNVVQAFMWEECDDENLVDGDGCSATCKIERCGDGLLLWAEECDDWPYRTCQDSANICTIDADCDPIIDDSLVMHHSFDLLDYSILDLSGNGNHWTIEWDPTFVSDTIVDDAWDFDGHGDYISVADDPTLNFTTEITLAWWVYPRQFSHGQWWGDYSTIVTKNLAYYLNLNASWNPQFYRYGLSNPWYHIAPVALPLNTWSHVVATYDGSNVMIYVDGNQVYTAPVTWIWDVSTIWVGMWRNPSTTFSVRDLDGRLDDIRIYNRALSVWEISNLYGFTQDVCLQKDWSWDGCSDTCKIEYCRDDAPLNDTSKNFVITTLDPTSIAGTSSQPNSELTICLEDTTGTRDIFYITTDTAWSFVYTPNLAPYAAPWVNVWVMLHDADGLDIDHHALTLVK